MIDVNYIELVLIGIMFVLGAFVSGSVALELLKKPASLQREEAQAARPQAPQSTL